jgi:hypothetical protein
MVSEEWDGPGLSRKDVVEVATQGVMSFEGCPAIGTIARDMGSFSVDHSQRDLGAAPPGAGFFVLGVLAEADRHGKGASKN